LDDVIGLDWLSYCHSESQISFTSIFKSHQSFSNLQNKIKQKVNQAALVCFAS